MTVASADTTFLNIAPLVASKPEGVSIEITVAPRFFAWFIHSIAFSSHGSGDLDNPVPTKPSIMRSSLEVS